MRLDELLLLLNPWWKDGKISKGLAKPYKRKQFKEILKLMGYRQATVIAGLRRTGKTTLIYQLIGELLGKMEPRNILYFNFDSKVEDIASVLEEYGKTAGANWKEEEIAVFLDEIVKLDGWATKLKIIYDAFPNIKFVVSASASMGLEKEAMKSLAGRHFLVRVDPLDFREYLEMKGKKKYVERPALWEKELEEETENYLMRTFPEIIGFGDELRIKEYLQSLVIDKIIHEDLPGEFGDVSSPLLARLLGLVYGQPGMYLNYDRLSKQMGISKKTLYQHMAFLEFSYLVRIVRNYRPSVRAESRKLQRAYAYWWNLLYGYSEDRGGIMENVVCSYLGLSRYWRKAGKEVDFLCDGVPVEVKCKKRVGAEELKPMAYFLLKYGGERGVVVYRGSKEKEIFVKGKRVVLLPLWKLLLEPKRVKG